MFLSKVTCDVCFGRLYCNFFFFFKHLCSVLSTKLRFRVYRKEELEYRMWCLNRLVFLLLLLLYCILISIKLSTQHWQVLVAVIII